VTYYWWDFDGAAAEGAGLDAVSHAFGPGSYDITLTVSNSAGRVTNRLRTVFIQVVDTNVYASLTGGNVYPYASWADAATDIQAAVNTAETAVDAGGANVTVWVDDGTFAVSNQLLVSRGILVRSRNGRDYTTVRRASGTTRLFRLAHAGAVLEGFTITNGVAPSGEYGGGVFVQNGTVRDCAVNGNSAPGQYGGGIYMGAGAVSNCTISGNTSGSGGGVYMAGGTLKACELTGNTASSAGGGLHASGGLVDGCTMQGNTADIWGGGGARVDNPGTTMRNCLLAGNECALGDNADYSGGLMTHLNPLIENCTVARNSEGGILVYSSGRIRNTIAYGNKTHNWHHGAGFVSAEYSYSCTAPAFPSGTGNLAADPLFEDAGAGYGLSAVPGDYRPQRASPCLNAATNYAWMADAVDLAGNARILDGVPDMGAYEIFMLPRGSMFVIR
jgi:parallel beta-helix repeat protein